MIKDAIWKSYVELAVTAREIGQVELGNKMLSAAMDEAQSFIAESAQVAKAINDLAYIYYQKGKYRQAIETLRTGLAMYEKVLGAANPQVANLTYNLAELYFSRDKQREARVCYERYVAIAQTLYGHKDTRLKRPLTKLAWLNFRRGRFELAHSLYAQALQTGAHQSAISNQPLPFTQPAPPVQVSF